MKTLTFSHPNMIDTNMLLNRYGGGGGGGLLVGWHKKCKPANT